MIVVVNRGTGRSQEDENNTPLSHIDLLVVAEVDEGGGKDKKDTPMSQINLLVVTEVDEGAEKTRSTHQRVILTHWWSWRLMGAGLARRTHQQVKSTFWWLQRLTRGQGRPRSTHQ